EAANPPCYGISTAFSCHKQDLCGFWEKMFATGTGRSWHERSVLFFKIRITRFSITRSGWKWSSVRNNSTSVRKKDNATWIARLRRWISVHNQNATHFNFLKEKGSALR